LGRKIEVTCRHKLGGYYINLDEIDGITTRNYPSIYPVEGFYLVIACKGRLVGEMACSERLINAVFEGRRD